ncbi:chromosomal replication initiator protein DnaA [Spirochaetia bacterium]|nr:chromosomal replication initiator protein DnaA [Spirochaetia bacterium]
MANSEDYEAAWNEIMRQIKAEIGEEAYNWWFNLTLISHKDGNITASVPSTYSKDQLISRYPNLIETKFLDVFGKNVNLIIKVDNQKKTSKPPEKTIETAPVKAPIPSETHKKPKTIHNQLKPEFNFENYIVGNKNKFAVNAALSVSKNLGKAYNPLLIYGGVGLGKTHLMQAIGNYVHANSDSKIIFVTAENFMNEFIESIGSGDKKSASVFRNKYRHIDLLMIDDIHTFRENAQSTLEELFNTYEALHNTGKQMVFTCDRPVSELKNLPDRLKNRFNNMPIELQMPDFETRCAIVKAKIKNRGIEIPDDVIFFVSKHINSSVRDLESALNKLFAYSELINTPMTVQIAQEQLKDIIVSSKLFDMSIDNIQKVVAEYFNLTANDLRGKRRSQNIVHPRHLAMFIARELTEYSTTEIGQAFGGKDHTTVMSAYKNIEEKIKSDPTEEPTIQTLIRSIKEYTVK